MNRLKTILLAGTIAPALVLAPLANAFAQAPEKERPGERPMRAGPQGGPAGAREPRGGGGGGGGESGRRGPNAGGPERANREPRQPGGMKADRAAPRDVATPAAPEKRNPEARPRGGAMEKSSANDAAPQAEKPGKRGRDKAGRNGAPTDTTPALTGAANDGAAQGEKPGKKGREKRGRVPANETPSDTAPTQNGAADNGGQKNRPRNGRPDDRMQGNDTRNGRPDDRGPRDRNDAGDNGRPGRGPDDGRRLENGQRDLRNPDRVDRGGIGPGGAIAIGAAAGLAGGFLAATGAQRLDEIRRDRRETVEGGRTYIREPGRTIVEDGGRSYVFHDENDRFRQLGYKVRRERQGNDVVDVVDRPGGEQILTYTMPDGRMLRRVRRGRDGREVVLIDNEFDGRVRPIQEDVVVLPPPPLRIPRDRYIVDYQDADEGLIYDTLIAPPVARPPQRYTLDQIRYSPDIRGYVRSVDINTINFDTGSWIVPGEATGKLRALAAAINKAIDKNPNSVFLVEGFTDATGNPTDNLSLSDRRAQSVAAILTKDFNVPPESLTTQGYGQQNLRENTDGPSAVNRRVVVQNITPLLAAGGAPPQ